jgi:phytoene dehydrogenase-like protein
MTLMNITELPDYKPNSDYLRNDLYMNFKNEIAENMIKYIQSLIPELKNCIDHYYTSTPLTIRNFTGSVDGSAYGIIHDYNNYIYSMIPVKTKLQNLFLSGQNINFHGMLGVSITALHTCSAILNEKIYN